MLDIVIIGAGLAGIGLGAQLKAAGKSSFLILERTSDVGGVWRDNAYPGCSCDTQSHLYSYSFEPNPLWSRLYADGSEILKYIKDIVRRRELEAHIRFGVEVAGATWEPERGCWRVSLADGATLYARHLVAAWGLFSRPFTPSVQGAGTFEGEAFHSAAWPQKLVVNNKKVAVVGSAASAIQIIPAIAPVAARVTIFQRTANWIIPKNDRAYNSKEIEEFACNLEYLRDHYASLYNERERFFSKIQMGTEAHTELQQVALRYLEDSIADPKLRALLTPDYPIGCKRVLRSDDFYASLLRDNVDLLSDSPVEIRKDGVIGRESGFHAADVIVFATGFETQSFHGGIKIIGRDGRVLGDVWKRGGGASAYYGMTVPEFPNFFILYGPNTNPGHHSVLTMLEPQIAYIQQALSLTEVRKHPLEVSPEAFRRYDEETQERLSTSIWQYCNSYFKNSEGRVVANWPGTVEDYRERIRNLNPGDYLPPYGNHAAGPDSGGSGLPNSAKRRAIVS